MDQIFPPQPSTQASSQASSQASPRARLLPYEEWPRLSHTPLGAQIHLLRPDASTIVVVEAGGPGGEILACWATMNIIHVEGLWEAPGSHAGVGRALLAAMTAHLREFGITEVLTQAITPEIADLCARVGGHLVPGDTWALPIPSAPSTATL